jgi:hypothetical protein
MDRSPTRKEVEFMLEAIFVRKRNRPRCWFCGARLLLRQEIPAEILRRQSWMLFRGLHALVRRERIDSRGLKSDQLNPVVNVCANCSQERYPFTLEEYREYLRRRDTRTGRSRELILEAACMLKKAGFLSCAIEAEALAETIPVEDWKFYGERHKRRETPEAYLRKRLGVH